MTLRDHLTPEQREAHQILDLVRNGCDVHWRRICWALVILGDLA